jgi:uncharacterized RDD family membrane protein YckC
VSNEGSLQRYPTQGDEADQLDAGSEYARWGRRAGGFLLDLVVVVAIAMLATAATGHHEPWSVFHLHTVDGQRRLAPIGSKLLFFNAISALVSFAYNTGFLCSAWQATVGMRAVGIHIAKEDRSPPTWSGARSSQPRPQALGRVGVARAAARSAIYEGFALIARVPFGIVALLVDLLWPLWDARRQTLHDKLARTVVLRGAPLR